MTATTLRRCAGSTRFGFESHEAPIADFPAQPSGKDGLGRMCKVHWNQYTAGLARDAKARKAVTPDADLTNARNEMEHSLQVREKKAGERKRITTPKSERQAEGTVVDATEAQKAEIAALEAEIEAVGGPETDAGQAFIEAAATKSAAARTGKAARVGQATGRKPSVATLERWSAAGEMQATDGCTPVEDDGHCEHGNPSWMLELALI